MLQTIKKGFTLIELLVVITIIGILATGAVSVYTSQIAKARDSTRVSDIKVIETAVVQASSDIGFFPTAAVSTSTADTNSFGVATAPYFNGNAPTDPRSGQLCNGSPCDYIYNTGDGGSGVPGSSYEISTGFESEANVTNKAAKDSGDDDLRMEFGNKEVITSATAANTDTNCAANASNGLFVKGDCAP